MIDWTKPLELMDGTPVIGEPCNFPDGEGDYGLRRVDGLYFTVEQCGLSGVDVAYWQADGSRWNNHRGPCVRNVETAHPAAPPELPLLIHRIRQWANDRNLIEGATSQAQTVKLFEEGGEVAHAVARGDRDKLKDGIGDMVVVLTILAAQNDLTLEECIAAAYDEIKDRTGRMVDGIFRKDVE